MVDATEDATEDAGTYKGHWTPQRTLAAATENAEQDIASST